MSETLKHRYIIRKQRYHYKQITVPVECSLEANQRVTVIHDGWGMLVVPAGSTVDEVKLVKAIELPENQ